MKRSALKACAIVVACIATFAVAVAWLAGGGRTRLALWSPTKSARLYGGPHLRSTLKPDSGYRLVEYGMLCDARAVDPASRGPPSA